MPAFPISWYRLRAALAAALVLLLAACAGSGVPTADAPAKVSGPGPDYRLEPGNHVRVIVYNEETLSGEFSVDPSGNMTIPLAGSVPAAGFTAKGLADGIGAMLKRGGFMLEPRVLVEVLTFRPYYVLGEVRQPGEFPYTVGVTVLGAIARAGGYDYRAREDDIILTREADGRTSKYRAKEDTPLQPGDIVRVLERTF